MDDLFPQKGLVNIEQVMGFLTIKRTAWYSGIQKGYFPKPIKIGGKSRWRAEEIRKIAGE